jgi:2-polyprenyl-3-methyl-5-hydroxy-6-metoxy-1,4-benzoquinol methylase
MSSEPASAARRACPLCAADDAAPLWIKGALRLVRCRRCAMVYADPVPQELAAGSFYQGQTHSLSPDKLQSDYAPVRFERELRIFRRHCRGGDVLDVGCSTGAFLFQLKVRWPNAYSVLGTDLASAALDHAESRGVPVRRQPFLDLDTGERAFDAVTFWAVMEHLLNPKEFLRQAGALLKPGGCCFMLVPNFKSLAVRLLGAKYRYVMPDHLNYFTAETFKRFAGTQRDLRIVEGGSTHFNPVVIWQDFRGRVERVPDAERARLLKRTTAWKQTGWLAPVKTLYGGVERMLGSVNLADNLFLVLRKRKSAD